VIRNARSHAESCRLAAQQVYRKPWPDRLVHVEGARKRTVETGRNRVIVTGAVFAFAFAAIVGRLFDVSILETAREPRAERGEATRAAAVDRGDILDRNGVVLATSLPTAALCADPRNVLDPETAAARLAAVLVDSDRETLLRKLTSGGRFVWLRRNLTPHQQHEINRLGIPGIFFQRSERRVYPQGRAGAHVLGLTDVDGRGIAGVERYFDQTLSAGTPVRLSLDVRIQNVVRDEVAKAMEEFRALGGAGLVLDVRSGEVLAMVSLPDFDPNVPGMPIGDTAFNRATKGVYEMGSTFKLFTAAMALDSGTVTLHDGYDASKPIRIARFTITDYHPQKRWLTVPEILVHSSNIGAAKMALDVGAKTQLAYLKRFGLLGRVDIELPEVGSPLFPEHWREINTMTAAYGHGIAISPLQLVSGVAALVNDGVRHPPSLLAADAASPRMAEQVITRETSERIRALMDMVVRRGTGKRAQVEGYAVGGKTGTAEKQENGGYRARALISSFVAAFPIDDPRYALLVMLDEPKGNQRTFNYATGGWVAAPAVGAIVRRMAPLVGMAPRPEEREIDGDRPVPPDDRALLVAVRAAIEQARGQRVASH
jgi:cell division protein FtsI (penicillin-binding protein 3)